MPEMVSKTVFVTGATSGVGLATVKNLAADGAYLVLLCRNHAKGEEVCSTLKKLHPESHDPTLLVADMANLDDLRRVVAAYAEQGGTIDVLVNNAGVVCTQRELTSDGFEMTFAVNHLAPFLLTGLLLPNLMQAPEARIVNVASDAHNFVRGMDFSDLQSEKRYSTFKVYGQSKLANLLYTLELSTRLQGTKITANALHPGAVATGLGSQNGIMGKWIMKLLSPFFKTPEQGAATSLFLCKSDDVANVSGAYFVDSRPAKPKPWALDAGAASRLWACSSEMTQIDYPR